MNPSSIIADYCANSKKMNGMADSCPSTPTEGVTCQLSCRLGGQVYPKGTIVNYVDDISKRPVAGAYNEVSSNCWPSNNIGTGGSTGASTGCYTVCIIPYTQTVKYAVKQ
jgi:hypothetical protein